MTQRSVARDIAVLLRPGAMMAGLAALFVGWVWLLGFPWHWVTPAVAVLEVCAVLGVLAFEFSSRRVDGAAGWMMFGFLMSHIWLFVGATALRGVVWAGQLLLG